MHGVIALSRSILGITHAVKFFSSIIGPLQLRFPMLQEIPKILAGRLKRS